MRMSLKFDVGNYLAFGFGRSAREKREKRRCRDLSKMLFLPPRKLMKISRRARQALKEEQRTKIVSVYDTDV